MPREWDREKERVRKAEQRARKKLAREQPVPVAVSPPVVEETAESVLEAELREREIRDFWGYGPSETRSKAERDAAAERMIAKSNAALGR